MNKLGSIWTNAVCHRAVLDRNARQTFDDGAYMGNEERWAPFFRDGSLEKAYRASGIRGVMQLTQSSKTQAYRLVAYAGFNRTVYIERRMQAIHDSEQETNATRLKHCKVKFNWVPKQEYCTLRGKSYQYDAVMKFGDLLIPAGKLFFCVAVPRKSVVNYMIDRGLKYLLVNHKVVSAADFLDHKHIVVFP